MDCTPEIRIQVLELPEEEADVTYDPQADAMYIYLDRGKSFRRTRRLDWSRVLDLATDGSVIGVELLNVSKKGVNITGLPEPERIARALAEHNVRVVEAQARGD